MEEIEIPMGVTCHNERDENGKWWIVWGVDFDNEPGRKPHPEGFFLEDAYKAGYDKRESEFVYNPDYLDFDKGVETGRELGMRKVVEWIEESIPKTLAKYVGFWQNLQAQKKIWLK